LSGLSVKHSQRVIPIGSWQTTEEGGQQGDTVTRRDGDTVKKTEVGSRRSDVRDRRSEDSDKLGTGHYALGTARRCGDAGNKNKANIEQQNKKLQNDEVSTSTFDIPCSIFCGSNR
jgi:hypothetical protein